MTKFFLLWLKIFGPITEEGACSALAETWPMVDCLVRRVSTLDVAGRSSWPACAGAYAMMPDPDVPFREFERDLRQVVMPEFLQGAPL